MSTANDPTNIVDFGSHQDPRNERVGNLLERVCDTASEQLKTLGNGMFERVDDALFDLAEKAENNAVQTQYFDGMREVRKKRALVERRFLECIRQNLSDMATGRQPPQADMTPAAAAHGELSLVGDSELEESLAIASMTSKAQGRLARPLYAVNQRLSVICGGNKITDAGNPIGPGMLCSAFRTAMRELDVETRVKLIIYKLFDRYVMAGLDTLYDTLNTALAQAGVLPRLRHEVPGQRPGTAPPRGQVGSNAIAAEDAASTDQ
ncbi:MAG TPA: DUF1631 family protein, partial [Oleiagrimonas sp.]|nr:DUF1631 family protein [Oleiagrimonas sp.]